MKFKTSFFFTWAVSFCIAVAVFASCSKIEPDDQNDKPIEEFPDVAEHLLEAVSPEDSTVIDLDEIIRKGISFEWKGLDTIPKYKIKVSINEDLSDGKTFNAAEANPFEIRAVDIDAYLRQAGVATDADATLYWQVQSAAVMKADSQIMSLRLSRMSFGPNVDPEERKAETITRKVAVLVEDPVIPATGKRIHETVFPKWGYAWNDPWVQMKEFERDMEASSHGVVEYEVVDVIDADRFFSYHKSSLNGREYFTLDTLVNHFLMERKVDGVSDYDYVGMMKHYGFDKKVDAGELHEVWVYTHPACGMYESRLIGEGAFWCNSPGIGIPEATNKELCCVMFCNYERTTDLAMHSYAHRVESIMSMVYNRSYNGWDYDGKSSKSQLSNFEIFSASNMDYDKFDKDHAHIGLCHYPPNSADENADNYNYGNKRYVYTYADTWKHYPYIVEENARKVNCSEWADEGGYQWGYMKFYFSHIPYFKGLNTFKPGDRHLNNWWYYIVDYNNAMKEERRLRNELLN